MRIRLIAMCLSVIGIISLSSCMDSTQENGHTLTNEVESYTPTVIENVTTKTETDVQQYHLFGMESLYFHKEFIFKNFELNEIWINEAPYYQFFNEQHDVKILIDENQENATLYHLGQSIPIDLEYGITSGAGGTESSINLLDITGDDNVELVLWGSTGGTGGVYQYVRIYDLINMQEFIIEDYIHTLYSFLEITPIETDNTNVSTFRIKTRNGDEYIRSINVTLLKPEDYEFTEESLTINQRFTIDEHSKTIKIEHGVSVKGATLREYLGSIKGTLVYKEDSGKFELAEDYHFE